MVFKAVGVYSIGIESTRFPLGKIVVAAYPVKLRAMIT
ncbi:Protein of unknown function [Bacillus toyonensis]|nr:Protein of unknown function [Bacillus toyonensis]